MNLYKASLYTEEFTVDGRPSNLSALGFNSTSHHSSSFSSSGGHMVCPNTDKSVEDGFLVVDVNDRFYQLNLGSS